VKINGKGKTMMQVLLETFFCESAGKAMVMLCEASSPYNLFSVCLCRSLAHQ